MKKHPDTISFPRFVQQGDAVEINPLHIPAGLPEVIMGTSVVFGMAAIDEAPSAISALDPEV